MKIKMNYKDAVKVTNILSKVKKESTVVRIKINKVHKKIEDVFKDGGQNVPDDQSFEFDDNERISVFISLLIFFCII